MAFNVHSIAIDLGAITGAGPFPALYLPDEGGGINILDAKVVGSGAGTSVGLALISITDAGTPATAAGTVGAFAGTVVYAANARFSCTISTPFVDDGQWIGVEQTSGTAPTNTKLVISYVMGK